MFGHIFFFFNDTATTEIYTLSLHDALPISEALFPVRMIWSDSSTTATACSRDAWRWISAARTCRTSRSSCRRDTRWPDGSRLTDALLHQERTIRIPLEFA